MRSIRYGDIRQILTSVADTTVTITSPTKRHFLITGSAAMYVLVLPDARTIRLGTPFIFENQSSEFVGVYNADLTTWHRIPPRATLVCVLATQATAAGTWYSMVHDPAVGDPAFGWAAFMDFNCNLSTNVMYSDPGLQGVVSGAGASLVTTLGVSAPGRQGTLFILTGTTAVGYALGYLHVNPGYLGSGCRAFEVSQSVSVLSDIAEEYIARYSVGNNITGGAHTEGAGFFYDRLTAGIVNWQLRTVKTAGGAGSTQTDTGIAVLAGTTGAEWQKLRGEINSAATRFDAFINNVQASPAGGLGTLPATTSAIKIAHMGITKSAGLTSRYLKIDYVRVQSYPLILR